MCVCVCVCTVSIWDEWTLVMKMPTEYLVSFATMHFNFQMLDADIETIKKEEKK